MFPLSVFARVFQGSACLSMDDEILTDTGWMGWRQLMASFSLPIPVPHPTTSSLPRSHITRIPSGSPGARLATLNPALQSIEFHPPTALFLNEGPQPTVVAYSPISDVHFEVTTDHDVYAAPLTPEGKSGKGMAMGKMKASALLGSGVGQAWRFQSRAEGG